MTASIACPQGFTLLPDADVTPAISARAVALLTQWRGQLAAGTAVVGTTQSVEWTGEILCDYRFEWHPPDAQNSSEHTGVTVYYCKGAVASPLGPNSAPTSSSPPCPSPSSVAASPSPPGSSESPAEPGNASSPPATTTTGSGASTGSPSAPRRPIVEAIDAVEHVVEAIIQEVKKL